MNNKLLEAGLPRGFEDSFGESLLIEKELKRIIEENFLRYGYQEIKTSPFEYSENIGAFLADDLNNSSSDIFTFNDKDKKILEIGYGTGFFISACIQLEYKNIYGADFHNERLSKIHLKENSIKELYNIDNTIWDTLNDIDIKFDFIYLSHVIEHIPKYFLLNAVDSMFNSLNVGGMLFVRCPNMVNPAAQSSHYVTLGHEYGFVHSNLNSLLHICGFDEIKSYDFPIGYSFKNRLGEMIKMPFLYYKKIENRLFGVNTGGNFGSELIMSGTKRDDKHN